MNDLSKRTPTALCFPMHVYEVRPRKDKRGVDLISDVLLPPFFCVFSAELCSLDGTVIRRHPAKLESTTLVGSRNACSRSHDAVIRVYDAAGNVIETHEHKGDFKEP